MAASSVEMYVCVDRDNRAGGVQEVESLRQQLSNYDKDKVTLQLTKQRLLHADKQLKNIEWEKEVLSQRFAKVEAERTDLYGKFEASILEVQQKTGLKGMLLERKVEALNDALEKKQTQLAEVLAASNLDSPTLQSVWLGLFWNLLPVCLIQTVGRWSRLVHALSDTPWPRCAWPWCPSGQADRNKNLDRTKYIGVRASNVRPSVPMRK